jgi:hypothetical protein
MSRDEWTSLVVSAILTTFARRADLSDKDAAILSDAIMEAIEKNWSSRP